jgi:aromatic-L-amino-acid decarboxylase
MAFRVHGADQYRAWIERTLANARHLTDCVRDHDAFELLHDPPLSTVCFRHTPPGLTDEDLDRHNVRLARDMQADGRIFIAPAVVDGRACLRACFVNFRTSHDAVPLVLEVAAELGRRGSQDPSWF